MGRHGMACTSSDPEFNSASDDVHAVPWGSQKLGFLEHFIFVQKIKKNVKIAFKKIFKRYITSKSN